MNKHTPGPWTIEQSDSYSHMAFLTRPYAGAQLFDMADAKLIAAAPDMAEALRAMCATMRTFRDVPKDEQEWTSMDEDALNAGFAALAKAGI